MGTVAVRATDAGGRRDEDAIDSSCTSPSSDGSERILNNASAGAFRLCRTDDGAGRWCEERSCTLLRRGRLLESEVLAAAFRLDPGAGEEERDAGGDGGNSGAGGAESAPKIL